MRQFPKCSFRQFRGTKFLSVAVCFALVGLEAAPAFARNNDDYYNNTYSNNYGPRGGYSASDFDRQMQQARARLQSFVGPSNLNFNSVRYEPPKLNLTYQPTIRFQYSPQVKVLDVTTKPVVKLETAPSVQKLTFIQSVSSVIKGIGAGVVAVFKKIGDGIVNLAQNIFGLNKKPESPVATPPQGLNESFKNLVEPAPGQLQTQNGKTTALGHTWEPGTTFKQEGNGLRLVEGTAFVSNFGGIVREGGDLPVRFVNDGGKVQPVGLDFDRLAVGTTMKIQAPVTIEGFGKLLGGDMTFKGTAKAPEGATVGKFQFMGAQVKLDGALGETLGLSSPANLIRATFVVESAVMELNSAVVEKGNIRVFVSRTQAPMEITALERGVTALDATSSANLSKISNVERDLSARSNAVCQFFKTVSQQTGLEATINFEFRDDFKNLSKEAGDIRQASLNLSQSVENVSFENVKDPLQNIQQRQDVLTQKINGLETQAESFREVQRGMRGVTNELASMLTDIDADRLRTEAPVPDQELVHRAATYFPDQKAVVCQQTDKAITGIMSLVKAGAMTPEEGGKLGAQMMSTRDKILGAVPNDAFYDQKRAVADPLQKTYDTSKNLVNRATDVAFFNVMGMEKLAEKYPRIGEAVGTFYLEEAKLAQTGAAVVGTAGLAYFAVTATITTGAAVGTAYVVKNALEYVGVNKEASTAYAAATSFLVGAKVGKSETVRVAESSISKSILSNLKSAWGIVDDVLGSAKGLMENESGFARIGRSESPLLVRKSLPQLPPEYLNAFDDVRPRTFRVGDRLHRSPWVPEETISAPGPWMGTRKTATKIGTESSYNILKYDNPNSVRRTFEFTKDVTVYYGKVKDGTGYQVLFPKDVQPGDVLKFIEEVNLK